MRGLSRVERGGPSGLMVPDDNSDIQILDPHTGELRESGEREDTVATISLGYKVKGPNGSYPQATKEKDARWIHVSGTRGAPALEEALAAKGNRSLTISFPGDTWGEIVQQHFAAYSASRLLVYGDHEKLTYIELFPKLDREGKPVIDRDRKPVMDSRHIDVYKAEEPEKYAKMLKASKAMFSVYFLLADWVKVGEGWVPEVETNRLYRLRTNSPHTMDNLAAAIKRLRSQTNQVVRGIPLELGVEFPEVADGTGHKRLIPSFVFRLDPPFRVTDVNFRPMLSQAVETGKRLALPKPEIETIDVEYRETPTGDIDEVEDDDAREVALIARGGPCNANRYTRQYFSAVNGTRYATDEGRAELISEYSHRSTASLAELLQWSTKEDAEAFMTWVKAKVGPSAPTPTTPDGSPSGNDEYERLYPVDREPVQAAPARASAPVRVEESAGKLVETSTGEIVGDAPESEAPLPFETLELEDILGSGPVQPVTVADTATTEDVEPVQVADTAQTNISDAEPIDFDYCSQMHAAARRLHVTDLQEPQKTWTGDELREYALELAPRMAEAERAKEEAKKAKQTQG